MARSKSVGLILAAWDDASIMSGAGAASHMPRRRGAQECASGHAERTVNACGAACVYPATYAVSDRPVADNRVLPPERHLRTACRAPIARQPIRVIQRHVMIDKPPAALGRDEAKDADGADRGELGQRLG